MAQVTATRESAAPGPATHRRSYLGMTAAVVLLHVIGWGTLILLVAPHHYQVGGDVFGVGLGLTAYTLGLRHAFDADHIAAIDNTTRKLKEEQGSHPVSVGFWFSLGHSTVVFVMVLLLALGLKALAGDIKNGGSSLEHVTSVFGASVSGVFLLLIGGINLGILLHIVRVFLRMGRGEYNEAELEEHLSQRGFMNRMLGGLTRTVRKPIHIYPIGVLFGFGFDTVTEVALLVIAGTAATSLPWYAVLCLPILFTAGMAFLDSLNGAFMNSAYGWAFAKPVRKVFYNMIVTSLSVVVAMVIGLIELIGVLAERMDLTSGPLGWAATLNLNYVGYAIVGVFVLTWVVALSVWHFGRIDERWGAKLAQSPSTATDGSRP
ncbi:MAG: HoxN/HupN/NixA family nickel/cobalt transporter [Nocardioidaceae bacterium]